MIKLLIVSFAFLLLVGCSFHPLGIPDEQWEQMSIEDKHNAYKKQQELNEKQLELDERAQALENEKAVLERERNGMVEQSQGMLQFKGKMIGGETSNGQEQLVISLGRFVWVDRIDFYAHDNINHRCNGRLNLKVDHYVIDTNLDIKKRGKRYSYYIGRQCRNIVFETATNDEVYISEIQIFGDYVNGIRVFTH